MSAETYARAFRRAARRVLLAGLVTSLGSIGLGALTGGHAFTGALWGGGAGFVLTLVSALVLAWPWERYPLLAGSGIWLSFAAKFTVVGVTILLLSSHRGSFSPLWFFVPLAVCVLTVTLVEILTLQLAQTLTVGDGK